MDKRLTRYENMPDFMLYNDQLCSIAKGELEIFLPEKDATVTMSMVNNYVKNKIIPKPQKKKYSKEHLARVIVITLLKQIFSIDEIKKGVHLMVLQYGNEKSYDMFCDLMEKEYEYVTTGKTYDESGFNPYLLKATRSIANNVYVKNHLSQKEVDYDADRG